MTQGAKSPAARWARARAEVDSGHPATGLRMATRALEQLLAQPVITDPTGQDRAARDKASQLRARILITMADAQVELGRIDQAATLLDEALAHAPSALPIVRSSRGVLYARTGRLDRSLEELDAAVLGLSAGRPGAHLVRALLWRGMLHLSEARLEQAEADTALAGEYSRSLGSPAGTAIATHNLGLVRWVTGDLPGALHEMALADEIAPEARAAIRYLDRARLLLAAGLLSEAHEFADRAERIYAAERSTVDLADVLLVRAEIDIIARQPGTARTAAKRAIRRYTAARHERGVLAARVLEARAEAMVRGALRPVSKRLATSDAHRADQLATDLATAGLREDSRTVRLLQAQALLEAGDSAGARAAADTAAELGGRAANGAGHLTTIATDLQTRVVAARLELAAGRRSAAFGQIRRGLDELARYQATFGSQDLQAASAVHGRDLTVLGLRTALQTRSPAAILQWLERSRAASTRLAAVRPPADGVLAEELSLLRTMSYRARSALLAGSADPHLEAQVSRLRRRVRSRSWIAGGSGTVRAPLSLAAVQRALAAQASGISVVAPFRGGGRFHALVITAGAAHHRPMEPDFGLQQLLQRIIGDLNVLADHRVPGPLRRVAADSLRAGLDRVAAAIVAPLEKYADDGPVIVAAAGSAAIVPWALLPGLTGRAVSVSPSVTAAVAGMGATRVPGAGVLTVAGPDVPHGTREAERVAGVHAGRTPTAVLTGPDATGGAVLDAMPAGGLLHIAAHGQHQPDNPLFSGVLLADGLLYGYDVAPNPALPAQVVLSSCDVGRTDDRPGSEPLGLVAALLRSGVRTVLAGTSRISDETAEAVMVAYHQRLSSGKPPAIALADAIAGVGDRGSDPAPFSCFGVGL